MRLPRLLVIPTFALFFAACSSPKVEPLMPTPLLYELAPRGPLDHIPEDERWNLRKIYYATTRERAPDMRKVVYGNDESSATSVGMALVAFGGYDMDWDMLNSASRTAERPRPIPLYISGVMEAGRLQVAPDGETIEAMGATDWLMREMSESIEAARDKDVLIYVHGAKVDFYNACAFAAQLDHFMGRDMTSIAFSWPTRQNIGTYVVGSDVARGHRSAPALASLIRALADNSPARRIHIITWSAGGRVVTETLSQLHDLFPEDTAAELRERYRIGRVYYAAADVPRDIFIAALPKINRVVQEVVVTASSHDGALKSAALFMGGSSRIGQIAEQPITPEQREIVLAADRLRYVDVSGQSEERGFDITGHRYWFNHSWASTDLLLTIRTDLSPAERGLIPGEYQPIQWIMPPDYAERIQRLIDDPATPLRESLSMPRSAAPAP